MRKHSLRNNNSPPQQSDPRIEALTRGYVLLYDRVESLAKRIDEQSPTADPRYTSMLMDLILEELEQKKKAEAPWLSVDLQEGASPEQAVKKEEAQQPQAVKAAPGQLPAKKKTWKKKTWKKKTGQKHLAPKKPSRKGRILRMVGNMVFYCMLVLVVVSALFIRATSNGAPRSLAGFTGMLVLTESMQSEIPKGSLVIAKATEPKMLQIGDDITYMANQTTTITHRIVGIIENYENTGQRAFQTQGIMNAQPDKKPVPAANVVGKVVFHNAVLGTIAGFIGEYWLFLLFVLAVMIGLAVILTRIYRKEPAETVGHK